jgi:hypothetical protein
MGDTGTGGIVSIKCLEVLREMQLLEDGVQTEEVLAPA